jgi:hypothetical protein
MTAAACLPLPLPLPNLSLSDYLIYLIPIPRTIARLMAM